MIEMRAKSMSFYVTNKYGFIFSAYYKLVAIYCIVAFKVDKVAINQLQDNKSEKCWT